MNFKPGDYVSNANLSGRISKYNLQVIGPYSANIDLFIGLVVETSNPNVYIYRQYAFNKSAYSLVEDQETINRMNKILTFI